MKEKLDLDVERKDRSMEEMAHEATEYRALFSQPDKCISDELSNFHPLPLLPETSLVTACP